MRSLLQAGARVQVRLHARGLRFCFIGGIANFRWGTPRLTNDLDLTVLSGRRFQHRAFLLEAFTSTTCHWATRKIRGATAEQVKAAVINTTKLP